MTEEKSRKGFAAMSREKQREIASKGGRAAHAKGTAHEWTSEEAQKAGRKGGTISRGGKGRERIARESRDASARGMVKAGLIDEPHHEDLSRFADEGNPHHE